MPDQPTTADTASSKEPRSRLRDDLAYILPMLVFVLLTSAGGEWDREGWEWVYPATYIVKAILVAILLIAFRRSYTKIRWNHWWLGILVGVVGVVQWVAMERWLHYPKLLSHGSFPFDHYTHGPGVLFIVIRFASATLLVPVMEELFWRDYLWRRIIAPNDFKLAGVGEWDPQAFVIVLLVFAFGVHFEWASALVWGAMVGALLVYTRSLGACIIAHAVTNALLGLYVLYSHQWQLW